ncbi:MAG: SigE family RNA polymerase sigma factor [Actinobacteria bacterium]|nr:SigE family RNA polymerase sigma factor [Actinomycetota bacterium]
MSVVPAADLDLVRSGASGWVDVRDDAERAFDAFVTARYGALVVLARYISRDPDRAEDVVQEVLGRVYARWSRIRGLDAPDAYVRRMVVRECLSWRRRRSSTEVPADPGALPVVRVDDGTAQQAERDAMLRYLSLLSTRQRAVLVLRHYEDLPDAQIAEMLGIREVTVRSHAMAGLDRLRALVLEDAAGPAARTEGRR